MESGRKGGEAGREGREKGRRRGKKGRKKIPSGVSAWRVNVLLRETRSKHRAFLLCFTVVVRRETVLCELFSSKRALLR